jgi:hypothetical protein
VTNAAIRIVRVAHVIDDGFWADTYNIYY